MSGAGHFLGTAGGACGHSSHTRFRLRPTSPQSRERDLSCSMPTTSAQRRGWPTTTRCKTRPSVSPVCSPLIWQICFDHFGKLWVPSRASSVRQRARGSRHDSALPIGYRRSGRHTQDMVRHPLRAVALLLVAPLLVGCMDGPAGNEGDCNARVGWDGVVYRPHNELNQAAPSGEKLGSGDVLDCDESSVATVEVFTVDGVDVDLAIRVGNKAWRGVYVAEGVPQSILASGSQESLGGRK